MAGAIRLAQAGLAVTVSEAADTIGGGLRSTWRDGVLHDDCSAFHPASVGSPYLRTLGLDDHGLVWRWPEVQLAHPLDDGSAALLHRSVDETAAGLGRDGSRWARTFAPLVDRLDDLLDDVLGPLIGWPEHPLGLARFGVSALAPASWLARRFPGEHGAALFGGIAAHAFRPLSSPTTAAAGLLLGAMGHGLGWPVAEGGSQSLADALVSKLRALGGRVETGHRVTSLSELGGVDVVLLDVSPPAAAAIAGDRLPRRVARAYRRYRFGPAAYKLDLAVEGGIPWRAAAARRAGTVHVGGGFGDIATAEADVVRGRMPERPFVLVGQQYLADPQRSRDDVHPVWAYAHVPHAYAGDATDAVLDQIERFAPGARERMVAIHRRGPVALMAHNLNDVGGDIAGGANTPRQLLARPRLALDPYATGIPGVYLCSASTPPGGGVHGMAGFHAAESALRRMSHGAASVHG